MTLNKILTCLQCNDGKDTSCMATCDTIELCEEKNKLSLNWMVIRKVIGRTFSKGFGYYL